MKNISTKVEGNMLYIAVDLSKEQGRTKGDKGTVIAVSEGFRNVDDNPRLAFSFMLYRRDAKKAA